MHWILRAVQNEHSLFAACLAVLSACWGATVRGVLYSISIYSEYQTILRSDSKLFSKFHQCQVHGQDTEMATVISTQLTFPAYVRGDYGVAGYYGKCNL